MKERFRRPLAAVGGALGMAVGLKVWAMTGVFTEFIILAAILGFLLMLSALGSLGHAVIGSWAEAKEGGAGKAVGWILFVLVGYPLAVYAAFFACCHAPMH